MKWLLLLLTGFLSTSADAVNFIHKKNVYATHQPVLYEIATHTTGPIIEFGCGDGSTELLHEICAKEGRLLISLDDNLEWLQKFAKKYEGNGYEKDNSGWHKFFFVPGKNLNNPDSPEHWVEFVNNSELLHTTEFDLCFVDQSPWLARFEAIKFMKDKSRYIILHDCDYFPGAGIFGTVVSPYKYNKHKKKKKKAQAAVLDFSDVFKYFKVYFPNHPWPGETGPPTLLGSDFESDLPDIDYSKY